MDIYQERYTSHQAKKREQLLALYESRSSQRIFNNEALPENWLDSVLEAMQQTPSSCARYAVKIKVIEDRDTKQLLGGILVGGAGWVHRAKAIILLVADTTAYKENLDYMKYLDTGFTAMSIMLTLETQNIGNCYINPNIRDNHKHIMRELLGNDNLVFTGSIAVGNYDNKQEVSSKPDKSTLCL